MKKLQLKSFVPSFSLVASFTIAAVASYLLVAHFQHTILQAWYSDSGNSSEANVAESADANYVAVEEQQGDFVCGCPFCCSGSVE